ncbi:nucleoside deaminase [Prochlorococcus sp. MIT 1341]|uniref:nucleoside deaminase n=1 Tax=Prochlorococcus sp. MIT 1341 TaxID=3096221 RepID=UPI002A75DE9B|nr:nucleoside deaminase [Prochlorococcus sp. MIT 1341]
MKRLLNRAKILGMAGEVPVCAVILDNNGKCIGHGCNTRERSRDPLGHAELMALRQAALLKSDWRFNDCTLIVTLEPCTMCAGALIQARMGKVIFAAQDLKRGGLGGTINLASHKSAHHRMIVESGVMEEEARNHLQKWFKQRRKASRENLEVQNQTS